MRQWPTIQTGIATELESFLKQPKEIITSSLSCFNIFFCAKTRKPNLGSDEEIKRIMLAEN
jgi:hypothetical protein